MDQSVLNIGYEQNKIVSVGSRNCDKIERTSFARHKALSVVSTIQNFYKKRSNDIIIAAARGWIYTTNFDKSFISSSTSHSLSNDSRNLVPKEKQSRAARVEPQLDASQIITYLSKNLKSLKKNMLYGFNISCVGDDREYSYLQSKYGNTLSDKVALRVLNSKIKKFKKYNWLSRGSDERQFCAPGVDLPVCSILRTMYAMYPEYHTSLDKIGTVVTKKGLNGSYNIYKSCIETIEKDLIPVSNILCEPQMGKRGLYPNISTKIPANRTRLMMNILSYCDETNSVFDISKLCNISTGETLKIINLLYKNKLIRYIK